MSNVWGTPALIVGTIAGLVSACASPTSKPPSSPSHSVVPASTTVARSPAAAPQSCRVSPPARLFENHLRIDAAHCIDVDGRLAEWTSLVETKATSPLATALATDGGTLFLAVRFVGRRLAGAERIHLRLLLPALGPTWPWDASVTIPASRNGEAAIVARDARPGSVSSSIHGALAKVAGAEDGFALEAAIPWRAVGVERAPFGVRASIAREPSTNLTNSDLVLAPLPFEQELIAKLLPEAERRWGKESHWLDSGDAPVGIDLIGDGGLERIGKLGGHLSVCRVDAELKASCEDRDYGADAAIETLEAHDIFGRGKQDLVVYYTTPGKAATHTVVEVLTPGANDVLRSAFRQEVRIWMNCCGSEAYAPPRLDSDVRITRGTIEIRAGKAIRLSERSFSEPPLGGGILPIVPPWDPQPVRRFKVRNGELVSTE